MRVRVLPDTATEGSHAPLKHPKHGVRQGPVPQEGLVTPKMFADLKKFRCTRPLGTCAPRLPAGYTSTNIISHIYSTAKRTPLSAVASTLSVRKERSCGGLLKPELQLESSSLRTGAHPGSCKMTVVGT